MPKDNAEAQRGRLDDGPELLPASGSPLSEDDVMAAVMAVFERVGTPPHIVYAAQKTG